MLHATRFGPVHAVLLADKRHPWPLGDSGSAAFPVHFSVLLASRVESLELNGAAIFCARAYRAERKLQKRISSTELDICAEKQVFVDRIGLQFWTGGARGESVVGAEEAA